MLQIKNSLTLNDLVLWPRCFNQWSVSTTTFLYLLSQANASDIQPAMKYLHFTVNKQHILQCLGFGTLHDHFYYLKKKKSLANRLYKLPLIILCLLSPTFPLLLNANEISQHFYRSTKSTLSMQIHMASWTTIWKSVAHRVP